MAKALLITKTGTASAHEIWLASLITRNSFTVDFKSESTVTDADFALYGVAYVSGEIDDIVDFTSADLRKVACPLVVFNTALVITLDLAEFRTFGSTTFNVTSAFEGHALNPDSLTVIGGPYTGVTVDEPDVLNNPPTDANSIVLLTDSANASRAWSMEWKAGIDLGAGATDHPIYYFATNNLDTLWIADSELATDYLNILANAVNEIIITLPIVDVVYSNAAQTIPYTAVNLKWWAMSTSLDDIISNGTVDPDGSGNITINDVLLVTDEYLVTYRSSDDVLLGTKAHTVD